MLIATRLHGHPYRDVKGDSSYPRAATVLANPSFGTVWVLVLYHLALSSETWTESINKRYSKDSTQYCSRERIAKGHAHNFYYVSSK